MTSLQQINSYINRLQRRLQWFAAARGFAGSAILALLLTLLFVWISNRFVFAPSVVLPLRILLFASVAGALAWFLVRPAYLLNRKRVLSVAEEKTPEFQQRLLTVSDKSAAEDPWSELLAEDALAIAHRHPVEHFVPSPRFYQWAAGAAVSLLALLWLITAGPGYWGYGAGLLWTGKGDVARRPLYDIAVSPGNKTIRRKTDQVITAHLNGFSADRVSLFVKYGPSLKWDRTTMQRSGDGEQYRFTVAGLSDQLEYYVEAKRASSKHFIINVRDLPTVDRLKVALNYRKGLGLQNVMLEPAGDIRAVVGTGAAISVHTNRPLPQGQLVFKDGRKVPLHSSSEGWSEASIQVEKDGSYYVAALDGGESIRISDDYIIEAKQDEAPSVKILKPGGDPKVSPIEELPVTVSASDDYGVNELQLHYSVNGGPEQLAVLSKGHAAKEVDGKTTLYFENFKVVPGDMVSFYATARDAKTTSHSDIVFAQAEPFDYKFSQSQQAGGGGGGGAGNESNDISKRQKQVIAATFNEENDKTKSKALILEDGKFLSDLQTKLGTQAQTLADRMGSRELSSASTQLQEFAQLMTQAAADMKIAADQLKPGKWNDAIMPEQKALTSLLRADALFRDIQVAFGQMSGGGGSNSGSQRDLARMLDLELDTSKNQYETGQSAPPQSSGDKAKALDDAFEKLQALARRQQEMAAQSAQQQAFEQRWQEEQLRREAEELRQELQKLAQDAQRDSQGQSAGQQSGQQSGGQQSGQQSAQQSAQQSGQSSGSAGRSSGSRGGQNSASAQRGSDRTAESLQRAGDSLNQAEEEMRKAAGANDSGARERAASRLREAQEQIGQMLRNQAGTSVSEMQARAQQLAQNQRSLAQRMKQMYGAEGARNALRDSFGGQPTDGMPEMNDPNSRRFGYGFRRPFNPSQARQPREATSDEKAIASEKERLAAQLETLEKQMQAQTQSLAGSRPDASSKLSRALSEAEGKELSLRMQKNAEWIRQGFGDRNLQMEDSVTAGLDQLNRDLQGVRDTLNRAPGAGGKPGDKTAQALAEVQDLRAQLERQRAARSQRSNAGGQGSQGQGSPGQGSPGENGQSSSSAGQSSASAGSGQAAGGDTRASGPRGSAGQPVGPVGLGQSGGLSREELRGAIQQLNGLRSQADPRDHALYGSIDGALGNLQHLTGAQDGLLDERLSQNALSSLQRLEVELARRVGQTESSGTRTGASEQSPAKYKDAVAGYFRKLSQTPAQPKQP